MDESVFIIIALMITLGLIAGLYFVIDLLSRKSLLHPAFLHPSPAE